MNKIKFFNVLFIAFICILSISIIFIPQANASNENIELELINSSNNEEQMIYLKNICNYVKHETRKNNDSFLNIFKKTKIDETYLAKRIYNLLGFSYEEINNMNNTKLLSILTVKNATVKQMILNAEDGESEEVNRKETFSASTMEENQKIVHRNSEELKFASNIADYDYDDIGGTDGKNGNIAGRMELYQNAVYDKYDSEEYTKDNGKTGTRRSKFYAYGYDCYFSMWWKKGNNFYTKTDVFAVNWDGDAYTDVSYTENNATYYYKGTGNYGSSSGYEKSESIPIAWDGFKPKIYIDLSNMWSSGKFEMNLKINANDGFIANMAYGHLISAVDASFNVGFAKGDCGITITCKNKFITYQSGPLRVECITSSEMEELR